MEPVDEDHFELVARILEHLLDSYHRLVELQDYCLAEGYPKQPTIERTIMFHLDEIERVLLIVGDR